MSFLRKNILFFTVFITGAAVLVVEVVAIRILAPYFGNTIFSVSSIIGTILAALSVGYYVGGKFADKKPSLKWFYGIILASGISIFLLQLLIVFLLPRLSQSFSIMTGPLVSAVILFFIPSFLLGTLSPFAIKLQEAFFPQEGVGSISGKVFFWSTFGSIFGSLFSGFILIPRFGLWQIIIATGLVLTTIGIIGLVLLRPKRNFMISIIVLTVVIGAISFFFSLSPPRPGIIYVSNGLYEKITIFDAYYKDKPARFCSQDRSISGGIFSNSDDHVFEYTKYYSLYKIFKPDIRDIVILGGGCYIMPKNIIRELPESKVDVVEIEPSLFELSKKFFDLPETPRLQNYIQDGRKFLHNTGKSYDLIYSDVYFSYYSLPPHFTTEEFFKLARSKLSVDGIFLANIIGSLLPENPSLIFSEIKTFKSVFPNSYFFATQSPTYLDLQNIIFVGYNSDKIIDFKNPAIGALVSPMINDLDKKLINLDEIDLSVYPKLTDNYCPVEYLTAKSIRTQR